MNKIESLVRLLLVLALAWTSAQAQGLERTYRIGWLAGLSAEGARKDSGELRQALIQRGYRDSQLVFDVRAANGDWSQLPGLARDLVAARADVIVATASPGARAAKDATSSIPVVFIGVGDPVGSGFVKSLARPGTNMTGFMSFTSEYMPKTVEVLRDLLPAARRIAVVGSQNPAATQTIRDLEAAAKARNFSPLVARVSSLAEIEAAFKQFDSQHIQGLIVVSDGPLIQYRARVAELATQSRLPAVYAYSVNVEAGGLMSYGPDPDGISGEIGEYVDRILRGEKPGDIPVRGPTKFELVVNQRAARAIGLTIPDSLLVRANRVIE